MRKQCVLKGLEAALERKAQLNRKKWLLDGKCEAGRGCWHVRIHRIGKRNVCPTVGGCVPSELTA